MRNRLPNRRGAYVVSFDHDGRRWTASFGHFDDGSLAELFLDAPKESAIGETARESALLASLALQYGAPLDVLRHALDGRDVGPLAAALALAEGNP